MGLFRRRESHHHRLAREGGLSSGANPFDADPYGSGRFGAGAGVPGVSAFQRVREWDAVVTVETQGARGGRAAFVALPDGTLVVEEGPDRIEPLAAALEAELARPYRAEAVRSDGDIWAVAGRSIELVDLPGVGGDEITVVVHGAERSIVVDGERGAFGSIPALERPGRAVWARRVDGEIWEVESAPL